MNPEDIFEIHGYYEELVIRVGDGYRLLGTRSIEKPTDRPLGVDGARLYYIAEPITLKRGMKEVVLRASKKHPIRCIGYAQAICGRLLRPVNPLYK